MVLSRRTHRFLLALRIGIGTAWGGGLVVYGLWLLLEPGDQGSLFRWMRVTGGIAALAAGQFVFLYIAAARLFPRLGARFEVWLVEMVFVLIFLTFAGLFLATPLVV